MVKVVPTVDKMLAAALNMDTGAPTGASAAIILFVARLAVRVEAYVVFLAEHRAWRREPEQQCLLPVKRM